MASAAPIPPSHPTDDRSAVARILFARIPLPFSIRHRHSRTSARDLIAASALPAPIQSLVSRTVRRTCLWPREQADVAAELIAHFTDAFAAAPTEAPPSPDALINSFGDERTAAKLIRRAKRRNRPLYWHVQRRLLHAAGLVLVLMLALYVRFFIGSPTLAHNYLAELNAPVAAIPPSERAWPLYCEGLLALPIPSDLNAAATARRQGTSFEDITINDPEWTQLLAFLHDARPALALFREAAAKPSLGRPYGLTDDRPDVADHIADVFGRSRVPAPSAEPQPSNIDALRGPPDNPALFCVLLPELGRLRTIARLLSLDARAAAYESDSNRASADLAALIGVAAHSRGSTFLIGELVSIAIISLHQSTLAEILERFPDLFDMRQIAELAHRVQAIDTSESAFNVALLSERRGFVDFLQRSFTDDGCGDGRITPAGIRFLSSTVEQTANGEPVQRTLEYAAAPLTIASRKQQLDLYDRLIATTVQQFAAPPWVSPSCPSLELEIMLNRGFNRARFAPVSILLPALSSAAAKYQQVDASRQAMLVVLAVHAMRLEHGDWPHALDDLVPKYLPSVPPDMWDGKPLKYCLIKGKPVIYSIGTNRTDDGGAPTGAKQFAGARRVSDIPRGDWIFFPPSRAHEPDRPSPAAN